MLSFRESEGQPVRAPAGEAASRPSSNAARPPDERKGAGSAAREGFDQLTAYSRVLMLQGPNGPFFARLKKMLQAAGTQVWKINFNGGDELFFPGKATIRFRHPMPMWESFLRSVLTRLSIDAVVVFGSARRQHRIAARVAQSLGIAFWVFEEGYVRPDYITLERGGVNADSPLAAVALDDLPVLASIARRRRFQHAFSKMAWYSFWYFAGGMARAKQYPDYRHHKPFGVHEIALWLRAAARKHWYLRLEQPIAARLLSDAHPPFFLVALQVYNDAQIRVHSPWRRMEDFIEWTMFSFAQYASSETMLVIKHHPMDRGHTDYAACIAECSRRYDLEGRVAYIHDVHLPSLLQRCDGVVTVNSTTGLQALHHRAPVITLGRCFYDKPGLTYQGSLDDFWRNPTPVDMGAYRRFRNYLVRVSQINSSFYADATLKERVSPRLWLRERSGRFVCAMALVITQAISMDWWPIDLSALTSLMQGAMEMLAD
ncbi:capsular biosynthesis protein [Cupriavidus sp. DF5525]|uniref:capsule biosynthesis protein n=1 Tax=Cupriavidus sp. DF5525 TaxID=3160989 RepID=UPI0026B1445E